MLTLTLWNPLSLVPNLGLTTILSLRTLIFSFPWKMTPLMVISIGVTCSADDAPTPTADAAGRAEDPGLLTALSAKIDRCMGRIDSLETELGTSKKVMGGAILTLVSRVKKLEKTVKQLRTTRLVGDVPASEGDVDIQDDVDLDGLSRMASAALGPDHTAVPSENVEEREEEEVPLRPPLSAGPSVTADKGKAPMPDLDIPAEFLAKDAQARKRFEEEQASERLVQQLQAEDLVQEDLPNVSEERAKELDDLILRMTETDWNGRSEPGRFYGSSSQGKHLKKSEVTQLMRNLVKNQWCAAHNGTITMKDVKAMNQKQLVEEYEYICRRLEKDRLLSAQYNLFRPKPVITEPPSKRQRVERATSQPASVPAATTHTADDPDSAGGGTSNPAGSAFGAPVSDSTVPTPAAMDSAGSHHESGVSPFADSADSSSPSNIGVSRVAADPDSDDDVLAEIIFRGKSISGDGVVFVDTLPDDEIVDPRVKVETVSDYASSPPRSRRKHRGVRSDDFLWDKPVEDFFSSESESDDDMDNYIPLFVCALKIGRLCLPTGGGATYYHVYYQENRRQKSFIYLKQLLPHVYREDLLLLRRRMNRYFRLNPDVDVGLDLWRDVNLLCQSLHSDDVEDFWRTQDEWIVSSWQLYPKSSVHVLDLTNGKTVYMFVDKVYPIRATLLERMLRHRLTVPPSYCRDVVVAGNIIQTVQDGLRQAYECLASAPIACTARQMVFSSPWLTAKKESGSPLQTALVCNSNPLIALLFFDHATSFDSAVHRVHAVSFDAAVLDTAAPVSAACGYIVSAGIYDAAGSSVLAVFINICCILCFCCHSILLLREDLSRNLELTESTPIVPADYVSAGHVLVSADRDRIC
ncbi:hypothetical protein Tco_1030037 [Tanacetum coccineum]|uniref:Uncharacterized protein n=1 Tax=Tanacetum coccineum TaxID=301880 RepID=A0ABQ5G5N6_9ASTR